MTANKTVAASKPIQDASRYFFVRVVLLQLVFLCLWWFVLYDLSLRLLRASAEIPFTLLLSRPSKDAIQVDSKGDWNFSIPMDAVVKDSRDGKGPVPVTAIDFAAPPANVAPFATGIFVYLGLALSLPISKSNLWKILQGSALQLAIGALGLFAYAEVNASGILANMHKNPDAFTLWILKLAYHIDYLVVPYASPFLVLLCIHPAWWAKLTGSQEPR